MEFLDGKRLFKILLTKIGALWYNTAVPRMFLKRAIGLALLSVAILDSWTLIANEQVYVRRGNLFSKAFVEPFELVYYVWSNGEYIGFTTQEESSVGGTTDYEMEEIREAGLKIEDCILVVHNHWFERRFTETDIQTYYRLRHAGFCGLFAIYLPAINQIFFYKPKGNDNAH